MVEFYPEWSADFNSRPYVRGDLMLSRHIK